MGIADSPLGEKWSYDFKNAEVEGTISVGFRNPQKSLAVLFKPYFKGLKTKANSTPIAGIQIFDTSKGNDPCSGTAALELTQFGKSANGRNDNTLILTITFTKFNFAVNKYLFITAPGAGGNLDITQIELEKPSGSDKKPFIYTAARSKSRTYKLILEITEWPKGDPLISHG
jgi:hypothetical protein